ncbi:mitochondrial transcription rescue factor 1-like isoform X2 [Antedon mediterranea]
MKHDLLVTTKTSNCVLATRKYSVFGSQNVCVRYYVSRKKQKETKSTEELESDEEEEMDDDEEEEVDLLPKGWKNIVQVVPSLRLDSVLSSGLGIARKKVEDAFLKSRLLVNNERVSKKSKMVKAGDVLDMIRDDDNDNIVMRVVVLKVASEKTSKNQIKIKLRRWKKLDLQGEESKT